MRDTIDLVLLEGYSYAEGTMVVLRTEHGPSNVYAQNPSTDILIMYVCMCRLLVKKRCQKEIPVARANMS